MSLVERSRKRWVVRILTTSVVALLVVAFIGWGQQRKTSPNLPPPLRTLSRGAQGLQMVGYLLGDKFYAMTVKGNYAYATGANLLAVYDISNPSDVQRVGYFAGDGSTYGEQIVLVGDYAYIVAFTEPSGGGLPTGSVVVVDVSTPTNPRQVGSYSISTSPDAIVVAGNYAYLGVGSKLHVLNIANPANPQFVREIALTGRLEGNGGVTIGNRLYLCEGLSGFSVWDLSQPDNPQRLGIIGNIGVVRSVVVSGNYAFVACGVWSNPPASGALRVIDVSNPTNMSVVAEVLIGNNPWFPVILAGQTLYAGELEQGKIFIINVSNPANPMQVGQLDGLVHAADVNARRLLIGRENQFNTYDITNTTNPTLLGTYPGIAPYGVASKNGYALTAEQGAMAVYDVTNPSSPRRVAYLPFAGDPGGNMRIIVSDSLAILSFLFGRSGNVFLVDVSNLPYIRLRGTYSPWPRGNAFGVAVIGNHLFVAHSAGYDVVDISNPDAPTRIFVGPSSWPNYPTGVSVGGNLACLVTYDKKLKVLDISQPSQPILKGELALPFTPSDVAMAGSTVVVVGEGDLLVADISDPANPRQVALWDNPQNPGSATTVKISGTFVLLSFYWGLHVFDLSQLPNLVPIASLDGAAYNAAGKDDLIYVASSERGLYVFRRLIQAPFTVIDVSPRQASPFGPVELTVSGSGFENGATLRLERNGDQIDATNVTFVSSQLLKGSVNLEGKPDGSVWDVVVRNPDGQEARKAQVFTVLAKPSIARVTPASLYPRTETLTIQGSGFMENPTVIFKPTESGVSEIAAQTVQRQNHTQLQVTFDFSSTSSYFNANQQADQLIGTMVVRNPNGQQGEASVAILRPIRVNQIEPTDIAAEPDQPLVLTLRGSFVTDEPLQVQLVRGETSLAAQTQVLSNSEAKATFTAPLEQLVGSWDLKANQLGVTHQQPIYVREFMRILYNSLPQTVRLDRLGSFLLEFKVTDVGTGLQAKLKREAREINADSVEVEEYVPGYWVKATFTVTQREDLGSWDLVLTRPDGKSRTYPRAVTIVPNIRISEVKLDTRFTQFDRIMVTIKGNWLSEGAKVTLVPPEWARTYLSEITPEEVTYSQDWTEIKAVFSVFDKIAPAWFDWLLQNFNIPVTVKVELPEGVYHYTVSLETPALIADLIGPNRIRMGREETYTLTINNHSTLPDTPFVILNFQLEPAEGAEVHYRVVDMGREVHRGVWKPGQPEPSFSLLPHGGWSLGVYPGWRSHTLLVRVVPIDSSVGTTPQELSIRVSAKVVSHNVIEAFAAQEARRLGIGRLRASRGIYDQVLIAQVQKDMAYIALQYNLPPDVAAQLVKEETVINFINDFLAGYDLATQLKKEATEFIRAQIEDATLVPLLKGAIKKSLPNLSDEAAEEGAGIIKSVAKGEQPTEIFVAWLVGKLGKGPSLGIEVLTRIGRAVDNHVSRVMELRPYLYNLPREYFIQLAARQILVVRSWDPNAKDGPVGVDGFMSGNQFITYRLLFENLATATASAEEVLLEDTLDQNLDPETLSFVQFGFGNNIVSLPENIRELNNDITVRSDLVVQVRSSFDPQTRKLTITFKGINPVTDQHHPDGFLPPNQNPPDGEGFVIFQIRPKNDAPSGVTIKNKATITFDPHLGSNPPMETNEHTFTLDRQAPQVQITTSPTVPRARFPVNWTGSDDASGIREVEVWVSSDGKPFSLWKTLTPGSRSVEGSAPFVGKFGYEYRFYAIAVDRVGNRTPVPNEPQAATKVGTPPRLAGGLRMVSLPVHSEISDPKQVFNFEGAKWAWYDPTTGQYVLYPHSATSLQVGKGFWTRLPAEVTPGARGELPDDTQPFAIQLKRGWNLIGNPWLVDLVWNLETLQVQVGNETKPLKNSQGIVEPYAWRWDGNNYQLVFDQNLLSNVDNKIPAWEGAWVFAWQDCTLLVPPPGESSGRRGRAAGKGPGSWLARLVAQEGGARGEGLFGVVPETRLHIAQPPLPPEGKGREVEVFFVAKEGYQSVADIRGRMGAREEWDVVVRWALGNRRSEEARKEVTLTWDGVGYAPKDVSLTLVDLATGTRRYMRTQTAYRFVPSEGEGERRFKVVAEVGRGKVLQVIGLRAEPLRGGGIGIGFTLTKGAKVRVEVVSLAGKRVAVVEEGRMREAGEVRMVWRGEDERGRRVPWGVYLVKVEAEDEEGRVVRAVRTVLGP